MSLLSETANTVLQYQAVSNSVVDNKTLDPILLPANSIIINVVVAPTIPLESRNLGLV